MDDKCFEIAAREVITSSSAYVIKCSATLPTTCYSTTRSNHVRAAMRGCWKVYTSRYHRLHSAIELNITHVMSLHGSRAMQFPYVHGVRGYICLSSSHLESEPDRQRRVRFETYCCTTWLLARLCLENDSPRPPAPTCSADTNNDVQKVGKPMYK